MTAPQLGNVQLQLRAGVLPRQDPTPEDCVRLAGDDFTGYPDSAALLAALNGTAPGSPYSGAPFTPFGGVTLDPAVPFEGHPTMRLAGQSTFDGFTWSYLVARLKPFPEDFAVVWSRVAVRFDPAFVASDPSFRLQYAQAFRVLGTEPNAHGDHQSSEGRFAFDGQGNAYQAHICGRYADEYGPEIYCEDGSGDPLAVADVRDGQWRELVVRSERVSAGQLRTQLWVKGHPTRAEQTREFTPPNTETALLWRAAELNVAVEFTGLPVSPVTPIWIGAWELYGGSCVDPFGVGA